MEPRCPRTAAIPVEQLRSGHPIRCFKLGRGRRSYNEVSLRLTDGSRQRAAAVQQSIHIPSAAQGPEPQESSITFRVQLPGRSLLCRLFLVFDDPEPVTDGSTEAGGAGSPRFRWRPVLRQHCSKGCQGPVLATSRRLTSLGKRRADGAGSAAGAKAAAAQHPQHMYVSIDEPCTHCGVTSFRLVAGIYDDSPAQPPAAPTISAAHSAAGAAGRAPAAALGAPPAPAERLLATAVSPPLKVLANNDVPTGPGKIPLEVALPTHWEGWADPAVRGSSSAAAPSACAAPPAPQEPQPPPCKAPRSHSAPILAAGTDSCSPRRMPLPAAGSAPAALGTQAAASAPTALAVEVFQAGPSQLERSVHVEVAQARMPSPSLSMWQELQPAAAALSIRSGTPVLFPAPAQPVASVGAANTAAPSSLPAHNHPLPGPEASASAAAASAWQRQQHPPARQTALPASASLPVLPVQLASYSSGCMPQHAEPAAAHLRRYQSDGAASALPLQAQQAQQVQQAAAAARRLARQEAKAAPEFYRVVRGPTQPSASKSPFGLPPPGAQLPPSATHGSAGAASFGCAPMPDVPGALMQQPPAHWQSHSPLQPPAVAASPLPAVESLQSWTDLRSTSSTPQPATVLLPGGHRAVGASSPAPAAAAWPMQQAGALSLATAGLSGGSAAGGSSMATGTAGWDAMPWAAYSGSATRQSDMQLLAAGLAAAGRLGLLPSGARQLSPAPEQQPLPELQRAAAEQQAAAYQQAAAQQAAYQQALAEQRAAAFQQAAAQQQAAAYQQALARQQAAAQQQAAAHQHATAAQQQAAARYQPAPAVRHQPQQAPERPCNADLLSLMLDYPNDFDSMVGSIFDDASPF